MSVFLCPRNEVFTQEKPSVALSSDRGDYYLQTVETIIFRPWRLLSSDRGSYYLQTVETIIFRPWRLLSLDRGGYYL